MAIRHGPRPKVLEPQVVERLLQALRSGNFRSVAAEWAGIDPRTMRRWMAKGRASPKSEFGQLVRQVREAERAAEMRAVALVMKAAATDARHAQWWLERKAPSRWGRRERHEVTGSQGGPVRHHHAMDPDLELLADDRVRELLDAAAAAAHQRRPPPEQPTPLATRRRPRDS